MRVYDKENLEKMSTNMLDQRFNELNSEIALVSKKNVKLQAKILIDKLQILDVLYSRVKNVNQ